MNMMTVSVDSVIADSRCQSRTGINLALVQEYAEAIKDGAELPPLSTIRTPDGNYLYDGFHRLEAYRQTGTKNVVIETDSGDVWDAIERSCRVNAIHGKRRTPEDTRRAVETILKVMQHRGMKWSQMEIAERCAVSNATVSRLMNDPSFTHVKDSAPTTVTRNGSTYEMDTAKIGTSRPSFKAPDIGAQLAAAKTVDDETGEILDDIPFEVVDPSDPATFLTPMQTTPAPRRDAAEPEAEGEDEDEDVVADALFELIDRFGKREVMRVVDLYLLS